MSFSTLPISWMRNSFKHHSHLWNETDLKSNSNSRVNASAKRGASQLLLIVTVISQLKPSDICVLRD